MATKLQFKRTSNIANINEKNKILSSAEPLYDTTNKHLFIGNNDDVKDEDKKHIAEVTITDTDNPTTLSFYIGEDINNQVNQVIVSRYHEPTHLKYELDEVACTAKVVHDDYSSLTEVVIPLKIYRNDKEYTVTSIDNFAFEIRPGLKSIVIPDSVTEIGSSAFSGCTSLTSVYVTDISAWCNISFGNYYSNPLCNGANLYLNGNLVTNLVIPDTVTEIKDYAFSGCSSLTSVTIPDSVTTIGLLAFNNCSSLTSATAPISAISSIPKDKLKTVVITSGDNIDDFEFYECDSLTSVVIGNSVTTIGTSAFYSCDSLTSVTIGNSVKTIGWSAFSSCTSLTSVEIPDSVTEIDREAFRDCSSLTSIVIPDSVSSIGEGAFKNCTGLTSIVIPDSVTTIGHKAFEDCTSLKIYCEATSKLPEWDSNWNGSNCPIVWGYNNIITDNRLAIKLDSTNYMHYPIVIGTADDVKASQITIVLYE